MTNNTFEDFDKEGQKLLQGLKFLSFEEVNSGKTGNQDPLATVRINKSFEEISNEYAKRSPFGENSIFASPKAGDFYEGYVKFIEILYRIGAPMPDKVQEGSDGIKLEEVFVEIKNDKSIFNYNKYAIENAEAINYWQYRGTDFSGQAILNKKIAYLDSDKIFIDINGNGFAKYTLHIVYENDSNVSLNNPNLSYLKTNSGIQIKFLDIDGLLVILSNLSTTTRKEKLVYLDQIYKTVAREIEDNIVREPAILSILDSLPPDLLKYFKNETLETIFFGLLTISLVQKNERIILNLIIAFYSKTDFNADSFLNKLLTKTIEDKSAFQVLYDNMNDWGGENNFSILVIELAKIWVLSKYSNSESKVYHNYEPTVPLSYYQNYILGFRNDNYTFEFQKNNDILVSQNIIVDGKNIGEKHNYHPFQPIAVVNLEETENEDLKLTENVAIPAFYLKAFDDKGVWENFEKGVWIALDLISLFSGIGNLAKLRYLIQTEKLAVVVIKTAIGIIQVASPVLSIGLSLVENSKNKVLVNKIRQYLFWVEICTLGADVLSAKILSKKANEAQIVLEEYRKTIKDRKQLDEIDEFAKHLEEVVQTSKKLPSNVVIGRYSKRSFDINNCGGEILNLNWKDSKISKSGIEIVKKHLSRFDEVTCNKKMIVRLEKIEKAEIQITDWDKRFYTHEIREYERYKALNIKDGELTEYNVYNNLHSATLEDFKLSELDELKKENLYHPDINF
jgi:hypothetical protein